MQHLVLHDSEKGFTLIEMIMVLAVAGILLGIAAPSFTSVIQSNRLATQTNDLVTSLNLARSEAITRGQIVTVCRSLSGTGCNAAAGNWEDGWLVFSDPDGDGVVDAGETVLRVYAALNGNVTLRSGTNFAKYVSFLDQGESRGNTPNAADSFQLCDERGTGSAYTIAVSSTGRVSSSRTATSCP